jgi:type I restriction enzyme R subunit
MNGFPESATADRFEADENRFPDRCQQVPDGLRRAQAGGNVCGQEAERRDLRADTLAPETARCRARTAPSFWTSKNKAEDIEESFQPFYDRIALSRETDPNELYNIRTSLDKCAVHDNSDVEAFAGLVVHGQAEYLQASCGHGPRAKRWLALNEDDQAQYKSFVRDSHSSLYSFMSALGPMHDKQL